MDISAEIKAKLCQALCKHIPRVHLLHKVYKHHDKSLGFIDKPALSGKTNTSSFCLLHKKLQLEGEEFGSPATQESFQPRRRASKGFPMNRAGNSSSPGARVTSHSHEGTMQGQIAPCENPVTC